MERGEGRGAQPRENSRKRRKLTSACDECRKSKTKCDGDNPCARCIKRGTTCEYSPQKRRGVRKKAKHASSSDCGSSKKEVNSSPSIDISSETITNLLDIYFKYFNPTFMYPIARTDLETPTDASKEMQLYICLAFASRATHNTEQTESFEQKTRTAASEVFDSFTESTALAFSLLTCYYWGQNPARSTYYSIMTRGICEQIGPRIDPAKLVLIEAMASCCVTSHGGYLENLVQRMSAAYESSMIDVFKRQLRVSLLLLEVKFSLLRVYPLEEGQKYVSVLLDYRKLYHCLSLEESSALISKLDFIERIMTLEHNVPIFGHAWPLISPIFNNFRSMLHFVKGDVQAGLDCVSSIIENCCRHKSIMIYSSHALLLCIHISFCALYLSNNVPLAAKAVGLLRVISKALPIAEVSLQADSKRLQSLISRNQTTTSSDIRTTSHHSTPTHTTSNYAPHLFSPLPSDNSVVQLFEGEHFDDFSDHILAHKIPSVSQRVLTDSLLSIEAIEDIQEVPSQASEIPSSPDICF